MSAMLLASLALCLVVSVCFVLLVWRVMSRLRVSGCVSWMRFAVLAKGAAAR